MIHVKTASGFEMDIDELMFNDMELFDCVAEVEKGHMLSLSEVVTRVVGDKRAEFYDSLRKEDGRVPVDDVMNQVMEIIQQAGGKNS